MSRLESAQDRLNAALLNGEDTSKHREAIAALKADAERESRSEREIEREKGEIISARTAELAEETQQRISAVIQNFPISERT